ncbi:MAG: hypothetical protein H6741_14730 [Alphaproteobacteria bacterium]|nr:hypothetical protein [Alphaproteobacteria bacterium]MCB9793973.1 hypothetical protein [Alphaproteobacteria bacterium]
MRLHLFQDARGLHPAQRALFRPVHERSGRWPTVPVFLSYRRGLFGKHFPALVQRALRGSDRWTWEELELIGAFTAAQLQCEF